METGTAKLDLSLDLAPEAGGGFSGWLEYDCDLFDGVTVERLAGHLRRLLEAAVAAPGSVVGDLPLLSGAERGQLLAWSRSPADVPDGGHGSTDCSRSRPPGRRTQAAVVAGGEALTYRELAAARRASGGGAAAGGWSSRERRIGLMAEPVSICRWACWASSPRARPSCP